MPPRTDLKHIIIPAFTEGLAFTPVTGFDSGDKPKLTARQNRFLHANSLIGAVDAAIVQHVQMVENIRVIDQDVEITAGVSLDIQGSDRHPLQVEALENRQGKHPIEILNVRMENGRTNATIFVPQSRLDTFKNKIQRYGDETKDPTGTKGATISIDSIEAIRLADLNSFWMEETPLPEDTAQPHTWEVWVRKDFHEHLRKNAQRYNITVSQHKLTFQECEICLITASQDALALIQTALAPLVGFSFREDAAGFFVNLTPAEQADWAQSLIDRLQHADTNAPAVCILDTGVRRTHPLLINSLTDTDQDAYDPVAWGIDDHDGHGTRVAGIALLEDVSQHLGHNAPIQLQHRLESVKILPPTGRNQEEHYGWITQESTARAAVNAPHRKRVFCLAVTASGRNLNGRPTAWSAALDKISVGLDDELNLNDNTKQLFIVSAGNIRDTLSPDEYPARNTTEPVENPAQSWNALSVGGITHKAFSEDRTTAGWELMAPQGGLSPRSRTSVIWSARDWPNKPDLVFEAGNYIHDGTLVSNDPDLSVLTTAHDQPFDCFGDTSSSAAAVARMAAILHSEYPELWPETIRGLLVHSASWTPAMLQNGQALANKDGKNALLRTFGYGVPDLDVARFSASSRTCLISQQTIQPFIRATDEAGKDAQYAGYKEMNLHNLPWPQDYLREYAETRIRLKVTLSYYIEPSPSRRIPVQKYNYASHQLKFDLQRPLEEPHIFKQRINRKERTDEHTAEAPDTETKWKLGPSVRNRGSISSDTWTGTAVELADQGLLAVMPKGGWWKTRKHLNRTNQMARYALLITLESDNQELDIYTQIQNQIALLTAVPITTR
ncbi:MAG: S8 family peptidase [Alphaproteobacteria bacterium]|nr:S8 family peptidase [Alphaproteobacteria bacterium]